MHVWWQDGRCLLLGRPQRLDLGDLRCKAGFIQPRNCDLDDNEDSTQIVRVTGIAKTGRLAHSRLGHIKHSVFMRLFREEGQCICNRKDTLRMQPCFSNRFCRRFLLPKKELGAFLQTRIITFSYFQLQHELLHDAALKNSISSVCC